MLKLSIALLSLMATGCSSLSLIPTGRLFLDSSSHEDSPPHWVRGTKAIWEKDGVVYFRSSHQIRGDERVNGCFDLARFDSKEALLSEIANDVKGSIDNAQQSISENAEVVLGKVRSGEFNGRILGLRFAEEYYERYVVGEAERVDCHVLGQIRQADFDQIKRTVVSGVVAVDARLREAIARKHIDFFNRAPADAGGRNQPGQQVEFPAN